MTDKLEKKIKGLTRKIIQEQMKGNLTPRTAFLKSKAKMNPEGFHMGTRAKMKPTIDEMLKENENASMKAEIHQHLSFGETFISKDYGSLHVDDKEVPGRNESMVVRPNKAEWDELDTSVDDSEGRQRGYSVGDSVMMSNYSPTKGLVGVDEGEVSDLFTDILSHEGFIKKKKK